MPKLLLILSVLFISLKSSAQLSNLYCINGRYSDSVFSNVTKTTDIVFGYNSVTDNSTGQTYPQTLKLDFYEPTGDLALQRPLIILAFGGGFVRGQRSDLDSICLALAKKGYAAATIDYRLIYNSFFNYYLVGGSQALLVDEVIKAVSDMKAAIRFFKHDAATTKSYRIDTTKIIIGGASAGSIAALHAAYLDNVNEVPVTTQAFNNNGGFEGNTDLPAPNNLLPTNNSRGIAGVINIAGGILDTTAVGTNNPPIYSAQGSADEIVPYNYGQLTFEGTAVPLYLYGSNLITTRAGNIGLKNQLYTIPGGNHESPGTQPYISNIIAQSSAFVQSIVCTSAFPITLSSFDVSASNCDAVVSWRTATESNNPRYVIEASSDGVNFLKVGSLASKNSASGADYTYRVDSRAGTNWFRLKTEDKDGTFTYSAVRKFTTACMGAIKVWPNPTKSYVTLSGLQPTTKVHMFNAEGKLLLTKEVSGTTMQLPLSSFSKGLYLVQVRDKSGNILTSTSLIKE